MNNKRVTISSLFACVLMVVVSAAAQSWYQLPTAGSPPSTGIGGVGYDATHNRLIAYFPSSSGAQVWVLTYANGIGGAAAWTRLVPTGTAPGETGESTVVYDSTSNQLIVYGGCSANCGSPLSAVYLLNHANGLGGAPAWSLSSANPPEPREAQSAVYNTSNKRMITFGGGLAYFGTDQNDVRVLAPANASASNWTAVSPMGVPPGVREGHTATYDQVHNTMTIFGGADAISTCCPYNISNYNDVWVLANADGSSNSTPTWTPLTPTGPAPPPRTLHSAVYDPTGNIMYIFGGLQWSNARQSWNVLGDVWKLSNANGSGSVAPAWIQVGQKGTPPGANYAQGAVFDSAHYRMIVVGGGDRNFRSHNLTFILDLLQH
jgi:hypothetical protein